MFFMFHYIYSIQVIRCAADLTRQSRRQYDNDHYIWEITLNGTNKQTKNSELTFHADETMPLFHYNTFFQLLLFHKAFKTTKQSTISFFFSHKDGSIPSLADILHHILT